MASAVASYVVKWLAVKGFAALVVKAVVYVAISYAVSRAMSKGSRSRPAGGIGGGSELVMSREPAPVRRIIYGKTRASGPMAFAHVSGENNSTLHVVVLLAARKCHSATALMIDDETCPVAINGIVSGGRYNSRARLRVALGDQTTADADMVTETSGAWSESCVLNGICHLTAKLEYNADVYSAGLPNLSAVIEGAEVYDPRTETTAFSRNPALILRDYMTNAEYGFGAAADEIDDASFIAAANVCDEGVNLSNFTSEPRYRCDGSFTTDAEPAVVIEQILATMAGTMVYAGGKFRCIAGAYYSPTVTLDEGDMRGAIRYQTAPGIREACNTVTGTYTSPGDLYQPRGIVPYKDAAHITDDLEEVITEDLDLSWVTSGIQAQRLAKIYERRARYGDVINLPCNMSAMRVQAGDTVTINNSRFGWAGKVFVVQEFKFAIDESGALGVDLVCRGTSPTIYGWTAAADEQTVSDGLTIVNPNLNSAVPIFAILDNDSAVVPANSDGSSPVLGPAVTTISVYLGALDDSANWTYTAATSSGVSGTLSGRTWTTTGFTADTGTVDITAHKSGYGDVAVRFKLTKAKSGASGTNGTNGIDGTDGIAGPAGASAFTLINAAGCAITPNSITKTAAGGSYDASAYTSESYTGGAFCSFTATGSILAGFNTDPTSSNSWESLAYVWHVNGSAAYIYESSVQVPGYGVSYTSATVFSITYDGVNVRYFMDGVLMRTVAATITAPLFFDSSLNAIGSVIGSIAFGPMGSAGKTTYFHLAYANSADGSAGFNQSAGTYIGTYVDFTSADSGDYHAYTWRLFKGADGANGTNGIPGVNGANGQTSYLHIKYSDDNGATFTASSGEVVGKYIGTYTDFTLADSTGVGSYTWALIKGSDGSDGSDATAYWLVSSAAVVQKDKDGVFTPTSVTFTGKTQTGAGVPGDYVGRFIVYETTDGSSYSAVYTSSANEASKTHTPSSGIRALRCRLYLAGGTSVLLDEETMPVVSDGADGLDGANGATILSSVSSSHTVTNTGWSTLSNFEMTVTCPAGTRLVTFSGAVVNSSGSSNTLDAAIYVAGSRGTALGATVCAAGAGARVQLIQTFSQGSPGSVTITMGVSGTSGGTVVLTGVFLIQ